MASKHEHHKRRHKKHLNNQLKKDALSAYDAEVIELLYEQINSLIIFLESDMFFFRYGQNLIYEIISENEEREFYFFEVSASLIKANLLALYASIYAVQINYKRYNMQIRRKQQGRMKFSLRAERIIAEASVMTAILFLLQFIGTIGIFRRGFLNSNNSSKSESIQLCLIEIRAFQIRYWADCFLIKSTISSMELVRSKYDKKNISHYKSENPDIPAVISGELYFVQRTMLLYANILIYKNLMNDYNEEDKNYILIPNVIIIIGNIIGEVANVNVLLSYIEIYMRNVNEPIFGR
ncbi:hypothetical protein [uncultured Clostridium sp.]|uniref:hypothetical protein n=1 Tax=uncultured Clostridium sp. TaxID=59620 RepID=UPI0025EB769C|nr:hypothetical protein [uncultured Clostridium sp.]